MKQQKHAHYCANCNRYWVHKQLEKTCVERGSLFGDWFVAKQCLGCAKRLRKEAHAIQLFERVARQTSESITGNPWM